MKLKPPRAYFLFNFPGPGANNNLPALPRSSPDVPCGCGSIESVITTWALNLSILVNSSPAGPERNAGGKGSMSLAPSRSLRDVWQPEITTETITQVMKNEPVSPGRGV